MISDDFQVVSKCIKQRNMIELEVSKITKRPFIIGHIGEYIASEIFDIKLNASATEKISDGIFSSGKFQNKSVNIKYYSRKGRGLDLSSTVHPDYYLVLMGSSKSKESCPWDIENVYIFESKTLLGYLNKKVKIGIATSVKKEYWESALVYSSYLHENSKTSEEIQEKLKLFKPIN